MSRLDELAVRAALANLDALEAQVKDILEARRRAYDALQDARRELTNEVEGDPPT